MAFTGVFQQVPAGYIGWVEELPGANTKGRSLAEARRNLREAVALVLQTNRELASERAGDDGIRAALLTDSPR